jgi:exosortase
MWLTIILLGMIGIFYLNTFEWLIESWLYNPYYSHGPLVPIISVYIIWKMRNDLRTIEKDQSQAGIIAMAVAIIFQVMGLLWSIRFLSGISLLLTILGITLYLYGWEFIKKIKFPLLFLIFMIPFPIVDLIAPPIQTRSAIFSGNLASFLGLPVVRDGLVLSIPTGSFEVGLPCSGLRSIISLLMIAAIYSFALEGGMLMKYSIFISAVPLALDGNIIRITSVLFAARIYGQEAALNYFHDISSLIFFSIALIGLFAVGRCFGRLRFKKIFTS